MSFGGIIDLFDNPTVSFGLHGLLCTCNNPYFNNLIPQLYNKLYGFLVCNFCNTSTKHIMCELQILVHNVINGMRIFRS